MASLCISFASVGAFGETDQFSSQLQDLAGRSESLRVYLKLESGSPSWDALERLLAQVYSLAMRVYLSKNELLAHVDVVPLWLDPEIEPPESYDATLTVSGGEPSSDLYPSYKVSALGGTFDHLHAGHKILLTMAASITSERLIVGVTDDVLLEKKKYKEELEPVAERIDHVTSFLKLIRPSIVHGVVAIKDIFGPTAWDPDVRAIIVSDETIKGGEEINKLRKSKDLALLDTHVIKLISADGASTESSAALKMGSTQIREWLSKR